MNSDANGGSRGWEQVAAALESEEIVDVLVTGYLNPSERGLRFRPVPYSVYFELSSGYLRLDAVDQFAQLQARVVDEVAFEDIDVDEDDEPMVGSCGNFLLTTEPGDRRCSRYRYWTDEGSDPRRGWIKCLEVEVAGADVIFADPTWYSGIKLGDGAWTRRWLADHFDPGSMREYGWCR